MPVMQNLELRRVFDFSGQFKLVLKRREKGVAIFNLAFDYSQIKVGTLWQQLRVNFRATTNKNIGGKTFRVKFSDGITCEQNVCLYAFVRLRKIEFRLTQFF